MMNNNRNYKVSVAQVYPYYIAKAVSKGWTKAEVDEENIARINSC